MMIRKLMPAFELLCCALIGMTFLVSGFLKWKHPYDFLDIVYQYQIGGAVIGLFVAGMLPSLEIILGACFLFGFLKRPAALLSLFLGFVFVGAQVSALVRGLNNDCGCFGMHKQLEPIGAATITRAALLVIVSTVILLLTRDKPPKFIAGVTFESEPVGNTIVNK